MKTQHSENLLWISSASSNQILAADFDQAKCHNLALISRSTQHPQLPAADAVRHRGQHVARRDQGNEWLLVQSARLLLNYGKEKWIEYREESKENICNICNDSSH